MYDIFLFLRKLMITFECLDHECMQQQNQVK